MKKMKNIYLTLTLISAIGMLSFFGCSKEKINSEKQQQTAQTQFEQKGIKAIKDFKQKVAYYRENPGYKSGETIQSDSVMFLLEGTINYSHAFMLDYYDDKLIDNLSLIVPKNGSGEVNMDMLVQKYVEMKAEISSVYYSSNFENKGLIAVDLSQTSQDDDEILLNVSVITGNRGVDPPPPIPGVSGPFEAGDNWWYGENAGKCYDTTTYSDAAQELKTAMSNYIYQYNQSHGIYTFFPVETHYFNGGNKKSLRRPNDVMDNHLDFYMYNAYDAYGISDDTLCVEYPEMNLYYQYLRYFLYTKMKDSLQSINNPCYHPAQVIDMEGIYKEEEEHYFHRGWFVFGLPWYYDEGEGPEEL
jgi:hypothetical protein